MDNNSVVEKVKELIRKGNVSRVVVRKGGQVYVNIPVNAGIVGGLMAPKMLILAGAVATLGFGCVVEVIKTDGQVVDVVSEEDAQKVRDAASCVVDHVKNAMDIQVEVKVEKADKDEEADFDKAVSADEPAEDGSEDGSKEE